jgi:hypothetical protein
VLKENINDTAIGNLAQSKSTAGEPDDGIRQIEPTHHYVAFVTK